VSVRRGRTSYRRAIEIFRSSGDSYEESRSLSNLGESRRDARDKAGARAAWRQALALLEDMRHRTPSRFGLTSASCGLAAFAFVSRGPRLVPDPRCAQYRSKMRP
jgi:hypothetical protein